MDFVKLAVGVGLAALAVNLIASGRAYSNGKFLGMFEDSDGFGMDDVAKGAFVIGVAAMGGMLVQKVGGPAALVKVAA